MQQFSENEKSGMGLLERQVEAMLFVSLQPVSSQEIASYLGVSTARVEDAVKRLKEIYAKSHGLTILFAAGGWQMATSPDLTDTLEVFSNSVSMQKVRLSKAALETLSIIAYNQPVTRSEIEDIRSVRCDRVVDTLMKHGLVRISGRKKSVGSPLLFRTTERFLEIFGLAGISSLPSLDELKDYRTEEDSFDPFERAPNERKEEDIDD